MKNVCLTFFLAIVLTASSATADDLTKFQEDSRKIIKEMSSQLGSALQKEMAANGPAAAITVCKDLAPAITSDFSRKYGQRVTRVTLKTRNPLLGSPDAWEQKVLAVFENRLKKELPANLEFSEIVSEPQGNYMRYMKAIPMQEVCLKCHGLPGTIPQYVKERISTDYPNDKATGYMVNQLRGAFSVKKAM